MSSTPNVFVGTWKLNPARSEFSPHHRPTEATISFTVEPDGHYLMLAEGINAKGEKCAEKPQRFMPDGQPHPLPDLPGLTAIATCPDPHTIQTEARREDGSIVGQGSYIVSPDETYLTATTSGYDTQLRQFRQHTVWDRAEANKDRYAAPVECRHHFHHGLLARAADSTWVLGIHELPDRLNPARPKG